VVATVPARAVGARFAERAGVRYAVVAATLVGLAALHLRRPATLCLLRATTGLPCPFCGGTTAAVDLGHGRPVDALAASPLAFVAILGWPLYGVAPRQRSPSLLRWSRRQLRWALVVALVASEVYELHRFGLFAA
jgi:hypothetical protein